jgi:hypothetical protein
MRWLTRSQGRGLRVGDYDKRLVDWLGGEGRGRQIR